MSIEAQTVWKRPSPVEKTDKEFCLFSSKMFAEGEEPITRADVSRSLALANFFVPISVTEKQEFREDSSSIMKSEPKYLVAPIPQQLGQTFSETVAIDTGDHKYVGLEILKLKKSTLDVQQKAILQGITMRAEVIVPEPQTFSETVAIDTGDHQLCSIELLKKKTSAMNIERKALPQGMKMEAEIAPLPTEIAELLLSRKKCIEAIEPQRKELFMELGGKAPVFVVDLRPQQVMDGDRACMACRVCGNPMPEKLSWFHKGKPIVEDHPDFRTCYDQSTGDGTLTIAEVFPQDAGSYECTAENLFGKAISKADLFVERKYYSLTLSYLFL